MSRARRAAALLCLALAACAPQRAGRLPALRAWPPPNPPLGAAVTLRLSGDYRYVNSDRELDGSTLALWCDAALRAYRESRLFERAECGWQGTGLIAEVRLDMTETFSRPSRYGIADGGAYQRVRYTLSTRFRDPSGRPLGGVEVSETLFISSPRFFALAPPAESGAPPAYGPTTGSPVSELLYDLHRAALQQALERGILRSP